MLGDDCVLGNLVGGHRRMFHTFGEEELMIKFVSWYCYVLWFLQSFGNFFFLEIFSGSEGCCYLGD